MHAATVGSNVKWGAGTTAPPPAGDGPDANMNREVSLSQSFSSWKEKQSNVLGCFNTRIIFCPN